MGDDFFGHVDEAEAIGAIHAALDAGVTLIDTAPAYGDGLAERIVGRAIADRRDKAVLATKVGVLRTGGDYVHNLKPESIRLEVDASLKRLGVETIDLYQIHWPDKTTPLDESLAELQRQHAAGKYRYLGVSNFNTHLIEQVRAVLPVVSVQPHYSLLRRDVEADLLGYAAKNRIGVLSYGTLAGGILTGKFREMPTFADGDKRDSFYRFYKQPLWDGIQAFLDEIRSIADQIGATPAQVVIAWTVAQRGVTCALVGAKRADQARSNAAAGDLTLSDRAVERIEAAYQLHLSALMRR